MNASTSREIATLSTNIPSLVMEESELIRVLENSLYPGAAVESIKLVIGYCRGQNLDPMQKPVHIVPMDVKIKGPDGDKYVKRDVIMPGIGLYRTQASRTGLYAGQSEPEFGPIKKIATKVKQWNNAFKGDRSYTMIDGPEMEFPEWCKVTIEKIVNGQVCRFTAKELWLENYATAGNDTTAPNAMWKRRPFAQLAKCAEAQALRKAFPDTISSQPTAEEMEGKILDDDGVTINQATGQITPNTVQGPQAKSASQNSVPVASPSQAGEATGTDPAKESPPLTEGERNHIAAKLKSAALTTADLELKFGKNLEALTAADFAPVKKWIAER